MLGNPAAGATGHGRRAVIVGALAAGLPRARPSVAAPPKVGRPVVLELFTSQGCSSCPPADALLRELARKRSEVLPLAFHVTYWDRLGWRDRFALPAATQRQRSYVHLSRLGTIYTPQMIVDGRHDVVGSDRAAVLASLAAASRDAGVAATLSLARMAGRLDIRIGAGTGEGVVWLVGFDAEHRTAVERGENAGRSLVEANVVRSIGMLGRWTGAAASFGVAPPAGEHHAVLVQAADGGYLAVRVFGTT